MRLPLPFTCNNAIRVYLTIVTENDQQEELMSHLKQALVLADRLGLTDVAIAVDRAIAGIDAGDGTLRDSAARIWTLPD